MEENKDKKLDAFVEKVMKNVDLEQPSVDFATAVLSKIQLAGQQHTVQYKPLISKYAWGVILAVVAMLFAYVIFGNTTTEPTWASVQWNKIFRYDLINELPALSISNTFVYGILGLTFFVFVQVFMLKRHIDSRYVI